MPIIDAQRKQATVGAIRMGQKVATGKTNRKGEPIHKPVKLDRFRITSPDKIIVQAASELFGGDVKAWNGARGPEWEVIVSVKELPVLIPRQHIDPNYEFWGNKIKLRKCDGATEKTRDQPCMCKRPNNHDHKFYNGSCQLCGLDETWKGEDHEHSFDSAGKCSVCGCGRICKPTTRLSLMLHGIPGLGYFKLESHGFNAAMELPAFAGVIGNLGESNPLPALLSMRYEERSRLEIVRGREVMKTYRFFVPNLNCFSLRPQDLYADSYQLATSARSALESPVFSNLAIENARAISREPALPTRDDVLGWIASADSADGLREIWGLAKDAGYLDEDMKALIQRRNVELAEVVDAVIVG